MTEELEQQVSDVGNEGSSDSQGSPAEVTPEAPKQAETEKYVPYDRFQEIIHNKNELSKRLEDQEKRYKELEDRVSKAQEPKSKDLSLIERLKGIDPEFGAWAEQQHAKASKADDLENRFKAFEQQRYIESATAVVERLKTELKVDPALHNLYLGRLQMGMPIKEIESRYKAEHDAVNKLFEAQKKSALSQYSTEKKKDAVPASPKGSPAKSTAAKPKFSNDRDTAISQIVKRAFDSRQSSE